MGKKRNYGYGRTITYAATQVIDERFGHGHFRTKSEHKARWRRFFEEFLGPFGMRDLRQITHSLIRCYDEILETRGVVVGSRQCIISTINTVLYHASRGLWVRVSPSGIAGSRSAVRTQVPASLEVWRSNMAIALLDKLRPRSCAIYRVALTAGVRPREAVLANYPRLLHEAILYNKVNILDGTKGGRDAPRWIPLTQSLLEALEYAYHIRPRRSTNLIAPNENLRQFTFGPLSYAYPRLRELDIHGYRDARAAYACLRYQQITGFPAPVATQGRIASRVEDEAARAVISAELGHTRTCVCVSYLGTAKPQRNRNDGGTS